MNIRMDMHLDKGVKINLKAFTLAEVLLSLTIVGIIAALTIPSLIMQMSEKELKTQYKQAVRDATQAVITANSKGLMLSANGWLDNVTGRNNWNAFRDEFTITKLCESNNHSDCWPDGKETWDGNPGTWNQAAPAFVDNKGRWWSKTTNFTGGMGIFLDINGEKGPNMLARDRFRLSFFGVDISQLNTGVPLRVLPSPLSDYSAYNYNFCPTPPCLYKTWYED